MEWTGLLLFLYIAMLVGYLALRDFIEDMSRDDIINTFKGTISDSIHNLIHPAPSENDLDEEFEDEEYGQEEE